MNSTYLSVPEVLSSKRLVYKSFERLAIELRQVLGIKMKIRKQMGIAEEVSSPLPKIAIVDVKVP
jgi:hypothetical protein